jgi:hypothetical protein
MDIAFYMGGVGHDVADAAQPLHNSIHHDGWSGDNPKRYTRDPRIHGRFETQYVDLIEVTSEAPLRKGRPGGARTGIQAFSRWRQLPPGLAYSAWIESAKPVLRVDPINQPKNPANPRYNPATGSAPAP